MGRELPVPGSQYVFDDCPRYYLRTAPDLLPSAHLIGGLHAAGIVAPIAAELRVGGSAGDDHPPKVTALARLMIQEQDARVAYELKQRQEEADRRAKASGARR